MQSNTNGGGNVSPKVYLFTNQGRKCVLDQIDKKNWRLGPDGVLDEDGSPVSDEYVLMAYSAHYSRIGFLEGKRDNAKVTIDFRSRLAYPPLQ